MLSPANFRSFLTVAGLYIFACGVQATALTLPPVNSLTTSTYNNFQVQSLNLDEACAAALDSRCLPGGPYPVKAGPGSIKDQLIILTGASGNDLTTNTPIPFPAGTAVDNVYASPTGNQSASFTMNTANEPGGSSPSFSGDQIGTWEVSIAALNSYLNGNQLVFLFNNNQQGTGFQQSLDIWGQVNIIDTAGNSHGCVELSNLGTGCSGTSPSPSDYVPAIGGYCVSFASGAAYNFGVSSKSSCNSGDYFVNDNLSTSVADYAVFSPFLNASNLQTWANDGYLLSVDVRYLNNNAGAEQLWICSECSSGGSTVPEPGTLPLLFVAFLVLFWFRQSRIR